MLAHYSGEGRAQDVKRKEESHDVEMKEDLGLA